MSRTDPSEFGQWCEKVHKECAKYGSPNFLCNTKATKFTTIPSPTEWTLDSEAAYVHYCANETVNVVEFHCTPDVGKTPLVGDMSSTSCPSPLMSGSKRASTLVCRRVLDIGDGNIIRGDFWSGACRLHQHVRTWLIAQASRNGVAHWRWFRKP